MMNHFRDITKKVLVCALLLAAICGNAWGATATLRPNGDGYQTVWKWFTYPAGQAHYECVDEVGYLGDGDDTHLNVSSQDYYAYFTLQDISLPAGAVVTRVRVYACARKTYDNTSIAVGIRLSDDNEGLSGDISVSSTAYANKYADISRPGGGTWSDADIDGMQAFIKSRGGGVLCVTQVWVEVTYVVAPAVSTQAGSDITTEGFTGNGTITDDGGATVTRRGFCYMQGTSGTPTTSNSVAYDDGSFGTGAYTKAITGLSPNTSYRVRAYVVNSVGTGYGTTVTVTTLAAGWSGTVSGVENPATVWGVDKAEIQSVWGVE